MRVMMVVTVRTPDGVFYEGQEYDVEPYMADVLIQHRLAVAVGAERKRTKRSPAAEQAVAGQQEERSS
jgi:hypothetical protein